MTYPSPHLPRHEIPRRQMQPQVSRRDRYVIGIQDPWTHGGWGAMVDVYGVEYGLSVEQVHVELGDRAAECVDFDAGSGAVDWLEVGCDWQKAGGEVSSFSSM